MEKEVLHKATFNEEGQVILKNKENIKSGKLSRAAGARFELRVRKYWEDKGFIVDKWSNNVDLENDKLIPAKRKYNPFKKALVIGTGFPDFIVIQFVRNGVYDVFGVEVKVNGLLSKEEKEKCRWYLKNNIFSKILVARKPGEKGKRGEVEHINFAESKWAGDSEK
ncbi:hypothetical protein HYW74_00235 [Candidatus Pacearchaeota archaeon]|nr:hypothetical protein [Candidatus Pacearchaeota archaeon]